ncbi:MAG: glutamine-hydrolyzing GMP synthase, partial [Anaerolineae bacterium]|nr:glutamine-hydrolyzing GMP synthase [Anaerolineae bacterium]
VREAQVYCELFPWDTPAQRVLALKPRGFILSGGPNSVYAPGAPYLPEYVLASGLPVLGICYGMQLLAQALGGRVAPSSHREYGRTEIALTAAPIWPPALGSTQTLSVWMSHGDRIELLPDGFIPIARSAGSPVAAMMHIQRPLYALQFHPEVQHTQHGAAILAQFVYHICNCRPSWTPENIIEQSIAQIRAQVADRTVICGLSGGVDSSVAAALVHRAVGDQLTCVFVNTGLLRKGEPEQVVATFRREQGAKLIAVDATETFLEALQGVVDPEEKRRRIGERFVRVFERVLAEQIKPANGSGRPLLCQGTLYPDVIESRGPERQAAAKIKTHHNVGGLPSQMEFELLEPLRYLFKDEVRTIGLRLGLPETLIWRHPFPGPGLAVRILGEVTWDRLERLRLADAILQEELEHAGLLRATAQAFAVLLPVRTVGVTGDERAYGEVVAIRAVTTEDFMTADWARLPSDLLARLSSRITNEVPGINRVVYDITTKPPATIEWE